MCKPVLRRGETAAQGTGLRSSSVSDDLQMAVQDLIVAFHSERRSDDDVDPLP